MATADYYPAQAVDFFPIQGWKIVGMARYRTNNL